MQRSSESIGAIAAALAKAQAELTNPEKSLIATIRASNPREADQTYRYAALSSGLDIVRKTLGAHEIAAVQSTAIDKEVGLIRLTTTLAHSSGEWLSSEWPVCAITETTAPRRMGAALTYARRYALFTLVGIAGEDDLDAPDLRLDLESFGLMTATGASGESTSAPSDHERRGKVVRASRVILTTEQSEALREQLVAELECLPSAGEAADWVRKNLPAKNTLTAADADLVETAFRARLGAIEAGLSDSSSSGLAANRAEETPEGRNETFDPSGATIVPAMGVPRRRVAAKTIRLRDKDHCKYIAAQPCVICGRKPAETHHLRFAQPRGLGRKVSDEYTVPLCRLHHRELHRDGDEPSWWAGANVDPLPIALQLWRRSRSLQNPDDRLLPPPFEVL
jgi:hypothetical protein